jgi:3-oxoacyl-[acyl-carrier-protein] synthase-3
MQEATIQRLSRSTNLAEFRTQLPTLTLGCGAAAMLLCRSDLAPPGRRHILTGAVARSAPECCNMCRASFNVMHTDAHAMLVAGGDLCQLTWEAAEQSLGWAPGCIDVVVAHQVSKKVLARAVKATGLSADQFVSTFSYLGNVAAASAGIALSIAEKQGRLQPGKRVALVGFGSGINCIVAEVMW